MTEFTVVFSRAIHQRITLSTSSFGELDEAIKACKARLKVGIDMGTGEKWENVEESSNIRVDLSATLKANMPETKKERLSVAS